MHRTIGRARFLLAGFVFATGLVATAQVKAFLPASKAETEVLTVLQRQGDAGIRRDVNAIAELLDPEYFHSNPDGSLMTRAQVLESYHAPTQFTFSDQQLQEVKMLMDGD